MTCELKMVSPKDIGSGDRYREDAGDINELVKSIKTFGVIQPLAVQLQTDGSLKLLAGGRRLQAIEKAELDSIPVRIYEDLSEEEYRSIELEENIQRKDLTWIETCRLQREIHNLRIAVHGERKHSMDEDGWSLTDTANLLNRDRGGVHKDIQLANAVDELGDVDWTKCKNKHEASKQLSKIQEKMVRQELARRHEQSLADTTMSSDDPNKAFKKRLTDSYILDDALDGLAKLEPEIAALVEIDPPYAIELQDLKKEFKFNPGSRYSSESYNEVAGSKYEEFLTELLKQSYRVMRENSWLILWHAPEPWSETIYDLIHLVGFKTIRLTGKWIKQTGQSMQPSYYLANACEEFFYCWKGRPIIAKPGRTNLFDFPPLHPSKKTHPTERPLELMQEIVETFTYENDQIIIPCCGSGNTIIASWVSKRKAFGYEISSEYREHYVNKINQLF